jgi:hypothetical protein
VTVLGFRENLLPSITSSLRFVISPITEGRLEKLFEPMYKFCSDAMLVIPTGIKPEYELKYIDRVLSQVIVVRTSGKTCLAMILYIWRF